MIEPSTSEVVSERSEALSSAPDLPPDESENETSPHKTEALRIRYDNGSTTEQLIASSQGMTVFTLKIIYNKMYSWFECMFFFLLQMIHR